MHYKFLRKETGKWESVQPERWRWEAQYQDGSVLKQFDDEGIFHQFAEIDQTRLSAFRMTSQENPQIFTIVFDPLTMKLVHFYRNTVLNAGTSEETRYKTYIFGYEKKRLGRTEKSFIAIVPGDEAVLTDNIDTISII